ncbi:MAG: alkane 1-monooxygenase [Bacteroidia bacterium]|nr:alkane 1-monooxygenase [Bacteroidia bacterium]
MKNLALRPFKYLMVYTGIAVGLTSFLLDGWWTWSGIIYVFGVVVAVEFFLPANTDNLSKVEEEIVRKDKLYDLMIWSLVPAQFGLLILFFFSINQEGLQSWELAGRVLAMGTICGAIAINVAHELGHRNTRFEQFLSKSMLLTTLYMHFFIEHNRGHHKNVSTPEDPASSRRGEIVYTFWFRSVVNSYISAWRLEAARLKKKGHAFLSLHNEMIWYHLIQAGAILAVYLAFNLMTMLYFVAAAVMGFLLLETVNYIEHYGLQRQKVDGKYYETVKPCHSWNSNHILGRMILFELSRHSDHHFRASRPYQVLRHFEDAPQMPTGYPGMVLLSLLPPLWFYVMHRQIDKYKKENPEASLALA